MQEARRDEGGSMLSNLASPSQNQSIRDNDHSRKNGAHFDVPMEFINVPGSRISSQQAEDPNSRKGSSFTSKAIVKRSEGHISIPSLNLDKVRSEMENSMEMQFHASEAVADLYPLSNLEEECKIKDMLGINSPTYFHQQQQMQLQHLPQEQQEQAMLNVGQPSQTRNLHEADNYGFAKSVGDGLRPESRQQRGARVCRPNEDPAIDMAKKPAIRDGRRTQMKPSMTSKNIQGMFQAGQKKNGKINDNFRQNANRTELKRPGNDYQVLVDSSAPRIEPHQLNSKSLGGLRSRKRDGQKYQMGDYEPLSDKNSSKLNQKVNNRNIQYFISSQRPRTGFQRAKNSSKQSRNNFMKTNGAVMAAPIRQKQLPSDEILQKIVLSQSNSRGNSMSSSHHCSRSNSRKKKSSWSRDPLSRLVDPSLQLMPDIHSGFVNHPTNLFSFTSGNPNNNGLLSEPESQYQKNDIFYYSGENNNIAGRFKNKMSPDNEKETVSEDDFYVVSQMRDLKKYSQIQKLAKEMQNHKRRPDRQAKTSKQSRDWSRNESREKQKQMTMTVFGQTDGSKKDFKDQSGVMANSVSDLTKLNSVDNNTSMKILKTAERIRRSFNQSSTQKGTDNLAPLGGRRRNEPARASTPLVDMDQIEDHILFNINRNQRSGLQTQMDVHTRGSIGPNINNYTSKTSKRASVSGNNKKNRPQSTTGYKDSWLAFKELIDRVNPGQLQPGQKENLMSLNKIYTQKQLKPMYSGDPRDGSRATSGNRPKRRRQRGRGTKNEASRENKEIRDEFFHFKLYKFLENEARLKYLDEKISTQQRNRDSVTEEQPAVQPLSEPVGESKGQGWHIPEIQDQLLLSSFQQQQINKFQDSPQPAWMNGYPSNQNNRQFIHPQTVIHRNHNTQEDPVDIFSIDDKLKSEQKDELYRFNTQKHDQEMEKRRMNGKRSRQRNSHKQQSQQEQEVKPFSDVQIWKNKVSKSINSQLSNLNNPSPGFTNQAENPQQLKRYIDTHISISEGDSQANLKQRSQKMNSMNTAQAAKKDGKCYSRDGDKQNYNFRRDQAADSIHSQLSDARGDKMISFNQDRIMTTHSNRVNRINQSQIEDQNFQVHESLESDDRILLEQIKQKLKNIRSMQRGEFNEKDKSVELKQIQEMVGDYINQPKEEGAVQGANIDFEFKRHVSDVQFEDVPNIQSVNTRNRCEKDGDQKQEEVEPAHRPQSSPMFQGICRENAPQDYVVDSIADIANAQKSLMSQERKEEGRTIGPPSSTPFSDRFNQLSDDTEALLRNEVPIEPHIKEYFNKPEEDKSQNEVAVIEVQTPRLVDQVNISEKGTVAKDNLQAVVAYGTKQSSSPGSTQKQKSQQVISQIPIQPVSSFNVRKSEKQIIMGISTPIQHDHLKDVSSHSSFMKNTETETVDKVSNVLSKDDVPQEVSSKAQSMRQAKQDEPPSKNSRIWQSQAEEQKKQPPQKVIENSEAELSSTVDYQNKKQRGQDPQLKILPPTEESQVQDFVEVKSSSHSEKVLADQLKEISSPQVGQSPYPDYTPSANQNNLEEFEIRDGQNEQQREERNTINEESQPVDSLDSQNTQQIKSQEDDQTPSLSREKTPPRISMVEPSGTLHSFDDLQRIESLKALGVKSQVPESIEESFYGISSQSVCQAPSQSAKNKDAICAYVASVQMQQDIKEFINLIDKIPAKPFKCSKNKFQKIIFETKIEEKKNTTEKSKTESRRQSLRISATLGEKDGLSEVKNKAKKISQDLVSSMIARFAQKQFIQSEELIPDQNSKALDKCHRDVINSLYMGRARRMILHQTYLLSGYHKVQLHSYDINFNFIENENRKALMIAQERNPRLKSTSIIEEIQGKQKVQPNRSSLEASRAAKRKREFELKFIRADKTILLTQMEFQSLASGVEEKVKERDGFRNISEFYQNKVQRQERLEQDEQAFESYASYIDLVWQNKNNKISIVTLNNPMKLDRLVEVITLFDAKTKTGLENVYDEINWRSVEDHQRQYQLKIVNSLEKHDSQFQALISQMVQMNFNIDEKGYVSEMCSLQNLLVQAHPSCLQTLEDKFKEKIRALPLILKFKVALCTQKQLKLINIIQFGRRFKYLEEQFKCRESYLIPLQTSEQVRQKLDSLKLTTQFSDYGSFYTLNSQQPRSAFYRLLFQAEPISLFKKLYDPDFDFSLKMLIDKLFRTTQDMFKSVVQDIKPRNDFKLSYRAISPSSNSIDMSQSGSYAHQLANSQLFDKDKESIEILNSDRDGEIYKCRLRPFKRMGAIDRYNKEYCKFQINQQLEKHVIRVKDSTNIFYKRIEKLINPWDPDYNDISRQFGYKSSYLRNLDMPQFLFEQYVPILLEKGNTKLRNMELRSQVIKNLALTRSYEEDKVIPPQKKQGTACQKIFEKIQIDDFHTDDSMKDIDLDDIKSDVSDDDMQVDDVDGSILQSETKKTQGATHKNMKNFKSLLKGSTQTPLEYYNRQRELREHEEQEKKMERMRQLQSDSKSSSRSRSDSAKRFIEEMQKKQQQRDKIYNIQNMDSLFDAAEDKNQMKYMKNKLQIENAITQSQKAVLKDNFNQIKQVTQKAQYIHKQILRYMEKNQFSLEQFEKMPIGRVLLKSKQEMEERANELRDRIHANSNDVTKNLYSNYFFELNHSESSKMLTNQYSLASEQVPLSSQLQSSNARTSMDERSRNSSSQKVKHGLAGDSQLSLLSKYGSDKPKLGSEIGDIIAEEKIISERANESGEISIEHEVKKGQESISSHSIKSSDQDIGVNNWSTQKSGGAIGLNIVSDIEAKRKSINSAVENKLQTMISQMKHDQKKQAIEDYLKKDKFEDDSDLEVHNEIKIIEDISNRKQHQKNARQKKVKRRAKLFQQLRSGRKKAKEPKVVRVVKQNEQIRLESHIAQIVNDNLKEYTKTAKQLNQIEELRNRLFKKNEIVCPWTRFKPLNYIIDQQATYHKEPVLQIQTMDTIFSGDERYRATEEDANTPLNNTNQRKSERTPVSVRNKVMINPSMTKEFQKKMITAVRNQNIGLMEDILKRYQGKTDVRDSNGNSLVAIAAMNGDVHMVKLLLNRGLNAETKDKDGNTPLHYAMSGKFLKVIDTLINHGVNESVENNQGIIPWQMSERMPSIGLEEQT